MAQAGNMAEVIKDNCINDENNSKHDRQRLFNRVFAQLNTGYRNIRNSTAFRQLKVYADI